MNQREAKRVTRVNKLKSTIIDSYKHDKVLDYERIVSFLMVEEGLSRRVAKESIDCLIGTDFCSLVSGKIYYNEPMTFKIDNAIPQEVEDVLNSQISNS